jgi:hypothetical protein
MRATRSLLRFLASSTLATAGLAVAVVGCGSSSVTPAPSMSATPVPSMSAEQSACLGYPPPAPGPWPIVPIVVRIDAGTDSAILLAGKTPGSGDLTYGWLCRVERLAGGNVVAEEAGGGALSAPPDPTLWLDQAWKSSERPDDRMVAGRVGPTVASVEVELADGTRATTAIANGYFLGWWRGTAAELVRITALNAGGATLRTISGGLLPPK